MGALKGFFYHVFSYYLYDIFGTNVEICRQNMPCLVLYMANRAARHGTSTARLYVAWHPTVPCCLGPPCPTLGPGTALCLSCAHRHGSPMAVSPRGCKGGDEELAEPSRVAARDEHAVIEPLLCPTAPSHGCRGMFMLCCFPARSTSLFVSFSA